MSKPKIVIGKFHLSSSSITASQFAVELSQAISQLCENGNEFLSIMEGVANGLSISAQLIKGSYKEISKEHLADFLEAIASKLTKAGINTRAKAQEEGGEK